MMLVKAFFINMDAVVPVPIPVQFNPPEYKQEKSNQFAEVGIPGLEYTLLQFVKGNSKTVSMELFFDTTNLNIDVRILTEALTSLMDINSRTKAPPTVLFVWGTLVFPCVLETVSMQFEKFNPAGMPLRATMNVNMKQFEMANQSLINMAVAAATSALSAASQMVVSGDQTLSNVATEFSGDPHQWRRIAESNGIDNPLSIQTGERLLVPGGGDDG